MKYENWNIPNRSATRHNVPAALLQAGFSPLLAAVLAARELSEPEKAKAFLEGGAELLGDPMLLKDMDRAAARLRLAAERGEHVAVYGDYDVDGITATCLMTECLRELGLTCEVYIPDRMEDGYGVSAGAVELLAGKGVSLIVTVDCGVTAVEEVLYARSLGVDMLITDHHECRELLPEAVAVVDPKRPDCPYPNDELAGVGVAFKLAAALIGDQNAALERYADLVAVGTVADVMPITGENRYMIRRGLEKMERQPRLGLEALIREAGVGEKKLSAMTIGFALAPRLNAAGRLGCSGIAAELLLSRDAGRCEALAKELCRLNRERQNIETGIWEQAVAMLADTEPDVPIVLADESWHQGVIGIAASRLTEAFCLPAVMICLDGERGKGSCRSYGGFNLFEALMACEDSLESFGGHALAAGLNIRRDQVNAFRQALADYYRTHKPTRGPALDVDVCVGDSALLERDAVEELERLEPCGSGNPRPVLCLTDALLLSVTPIGGGRHVRMRVSKFGQEYACVFFSHRAENLGVRAGDRVDLAFCPQINVFRGRRSVQLLVTDICPSRQEELCARVLSGADVLDREAVEIVPERADFVRLWRGIKTMGGGLRAAVEEALYLLDPVGTRARACVCLRVFAELGLLKMELKENVLSLSLSGAGDKVDLEASVLLRALREQAFRAEQGNC